MTNALANPGPGPWLLALINLIFPDSRRPTDLGMLNERMNKNE